MGGQKTSRALDGVPRRGRECVIASPLLKISFPSCASLVVAVVGRVVVTR